MPEVSTETNVSTITETIASDTETYTATSETTQEDLRGKLYEEIEIDPNESDGLNDLGYRDATGQLVTEVGNGDVVDGYGLSYGGKNNIRVLGLPLIFSPLDDPNQRVFQNTIESDVPIVFITPGKPIINKKAFGAMDDTGLFKIFNTINAFVGKAATTVGRMFGVANIEDSRFISFKPAYTDYFRYVQTTLQYIHTALGLPGYFDFSHYDDSFNYGLAFYLSKGSDVSESSNNEYMQSDVAREVSSTQYDIRQKKMMASMGGGNILDRISESIKELVVEKTENIPVLGGLVGSFVEALGGSEIYYPDLWSNSTFDRSYSLEFKFYSPYGDPQSIMNFVYVPFISLITMGLPLQDSYFSYKQPFLVRISAPGRFECEAGVIRSMTIIRGEEQTWTAESFPREITVRLTISDLYPSLTLASNSNSMKYNIGLTSYIECMAGMRYDQLNLFKRLGMKLDIFGNRLYNIISLNKWTNEFYERGYKTTNSGVVKFFTR